MKRANENIISKNTHYNFEKIYFCQEILITREPYIFKTTQAKVTIIFHIRARKKIDKTHLKFSMAHVTNSSHQQPAIFFSCSNLFFIILFFTKIQCHRSSSTGQFFFCAGHNKLCITSLFDPINEIRRRRRRRFGVAYQMDFAPLTSSGQIIDCLLHCSYLYVT